MVRVVCDADLRRVLIDYLPPSLRPRSPQGFFFYDLNGKLNLCQLPPGASFDADMVVTRVPLGLTPRFVVRHEAINIYAVAAFKEVSRAGGLHYARSADVLDRSLFRTRTSLQSALPRFERKSSKCSSSIRARGRFAVATTISRSTSGCSAYDTCDSAKR